MLSFQFQSPSFLWALLLIPLLIYLRSKSGKSASIQFPSIELARFASKQSFTNPAAILFTLRLIALTACIFALARPQFAKGYSEVDAPGIDIMLALDISTSMYALDMDTKNQLTTRVDVAKKVLEQFVENRKTDRLGLITFAGAPYLVCPLTLNHDWLIQNLQRLQPGMIEDGTAIGDAIAMATNRMRSIAAKTKVVIILTDGANNIGRVSPFIAAELAANFHIKVYSVTIGQEGIVNALFLDQTGQIAKDFFGRPIVAQGSFPIDMDTMEKIAEITDAKAYRATDLDQLKKIYNEIDQLEKTDVKLTKYTDFTELYPAFLLIALLFLGLEVLLANSKLRVLP